MNSNDQINERIAGFLTGELPPEEMNALQQWIIASDENRRYFDEMKGAWQAAASVDASSTFRPEKAWQKLTDRQQFKPYNNRQRDSVNLIRQRIKRFIKRSLQATAAVAAIFLAGALTSYLNLKAEIKQAEELKALAGAEHKVIVPRGALSTIVLPDGSKVVLNGASKMTYATDYGFSSREITLVGEAYFDVTSNAEKPFTVYTSDIVIQAFGTAFNVKAYDEDPTIVTTLEHGELKLSSRNDNTMDVTLKPKQNVVYYKNDPIVSKQEKTSNSVEQPPVNPENMTDVPVVTVIDQVNTGLYTSWKDPEWLIESQTLGELANSLERRYNIHMMFASNDLKSYRFSGTIRNETIEQILNVLTFTAPMKYTIEQGVVRLQIDSKRKSNYDAVTR